MSKRIAVSAIWTAPEESLAITRKLAAAEPGNAGRLTDFMATRDGLTLAKAFMRISNAQLRRRIVNLIEEYQD